jgi:hypothetical protein
MCSIKRRESLHSALARTRSEPVRMGLLPIEKRRGCCAFQPSFILAGLLRAGVGAALAYVPNREGLRVVVERSSRQHRISYRTAIGRLP